MLRVADLSIPINESDPVLSRPSQPTA